MFSMVKVQLRREAAMEKWLRPIRGAIGMGVTWAVGWGFAGVLAAAASSLLPSSWLAPFLQIFDAPAPALAVPGLVGGALFSIVIGIAGRGRKFHELSLPRFVAWGAVAGVLLSLVPVAMVAVGLAHVGNPDINLWKITATIFGPVFALLGAASAFGSLKLARMAAGPKLVEAGK
jgi:hypothetical protein